MTEPPSRPNSTIVPAPSAALTERRAKLVSRGLREAASLQVGQLNAELIERFFNRVKSNYTAAVAKMLLQGPSLVSSREAALGRTALHYAAALANLGMATLLLDCGAPVLAKDSTGYSPLLDAIESSPTGRKVAMLLLDRGADPNEPSDTGVFPFFAAAMNNDGEMVQRLLQCGLDPHTRTKNNKSLLLQAAFLSCEPAARLLLDAGLDPNARDNNG